MENFLSKIEEGYSRHKNPYHNNLHGADVAQTVHYMLCQTGLMVIERIMTNLCYKYMYSWRNVRVYKKSHANESRFGTIQCYLNLKRVILSFIQSCLDIILRYVVNKYNTNIFNFFTFSVVELAYGFRNIRNVNSCHYTWFWTHRNHK